VVFVWEKVIKMQSVTHTKKNTNHKTCYFCLFKIQNTEEIHSKTKKKRGS